MKAKNVISIADGEIINYPTVADISNEEKRIYYSKRQAEYKKACSNCGTIYDIRTYKECPLCELKAKNAQLEKRNELNKKLEEEVNKNRKETENKRTCSVCGNVYDIHTYIECPFCELKAKNAQLEKRNELNKKLEEEVNKSRREKENKRTCSVCGNIYDIHTYRECPLCELKEKNTKLERKVELEQKLKEKNIQLRRNLESGQRLKVSKDTKPEMKNEKVISCEKINKQTNIDDNKKQEKDNVEENSRELYKKKIPKKLENVISFCEMLMMLVAILISYGMFYKSETDINSKQLFIILWVGIPILSYIVVFLLAEMNSNCWNLLFSIFYTIIFISTFFLSEIINETPSAGVFAWSKILAYYLLGISLIFLALIWDECGIKGYDKRGELFRDLVKYVLPWALASIILIVFTLNPFLMEIRKAFPWIPLNK